MKKLLIALSLALATTGAYAKEEKAATPQQSKMADCNKEAKDQKMRGDERKAFMKICLSSKPAEVPAEAKVEAKKELTPQQMKMGNCNKEAKAKELKGPERKKFMSECLKGGAKSEKPGEKK